MTSDRTGASARPDPGRPGKNRYPAVAYISFKRIIRLPKPRISPMVTQTTTVAASPNVKSRGMTSFFSSVRWKASAAPSRSTAREPPLPSASKDTRNVSQATQKDDYGYGRVNHAEGSLSHRYVAHINTPYLQFDTPRILSERFRGPGVRNSMAWPTDKPISAAPTGVRTEMRFSEISASCGYTSTTSRM